MIFNPEVPSRKRWRIRNMIALLFALTLPGSGVSAQDVQQKSSPATALLDRFKSERVFYRQLDLARQVVALHDNTVLPELVGLLNHDDRHLRGNVAFIFGALGDERGFAVISDILKDRSDRPEGQGQVISSDGRYHVAQQVRADRYYAAHLFGDLKDRRAVPILIPLLHDSEISSVVPWALGEIGDNRADGPLIDVLDDRDPSMRVLAINALKKLGATEALPRLYQLLDDHEKASFGEQASVAESARGAIAQLESQR